MRLWSSQVHPFRAWGESQKAGEMNPPCIKCEHSFVAPLTYGDSGRRCGLAEIVHRTTSGSSWTSYDSCENLRRFDGNCDEYERAPWWRRAWNKL